MACSWPRTCAGCKRLDSILDRQEQTCAVCAYFGPDVGDVPVCHKFLKTMLPCDGCGEWRGRLEGAMERLTYDFCIGSNHCWQIKGADNFMCKEVCIKQVDDGCTNCPIKKAFDRLAAYEDAGLEPEEYKKHADSIKKLDIEHMHDLLQAEMDGRLAALPCKVGDVVYEANKRGVISTYKVISIHLSAYSTRIEWELTDGVYSNLNGFEASLLGKTVFLTREEAEAALKKREADNEWI